MSLVGGIFQIYNTDRRIDQSKEVIFFRVWVKARCDWELGPLNFGVFFVPKCFSENCSAYVLLSQNLDNAWQWVKGLNTGGSTNTLAALKVALADPQCHAIYLLTDGRPDQVL